MGVDQVGLLTRRAVNKSSMSAVSGYWAKVCIPVLSETPAALDLETIKIMYKEVHNGLKIQVAEQYFLAPRLEAIISEIDKGTIGEPVSISLRYEILEA